MISEDQRLWEKLVEHANAEKDGHLTPGQAIVETQIKHLRG